MTAAAPGRRLLTPAEVADLFRVDPKTVTRYARAGKLRSIRTPGGQHRFYEDEVQAVLDGAPEAQHPDGDVPADAKPDAA